MKIDLDFVAWKEQNTFEVPRQPIKINVMADGDHLSYAEFGDFLLEDALFSVMRGELESHRQFAEDPNEKMWAHPEDYANSMSIALELRRLADEYMKFVADNYTTKSKWER